MLLTDKLHVQETVQWNGREICIDMSFDNILCILDIFMDKEIDEPYKVSLALYRLIEEFDGMSKYFSENGEDTVKFLSAILENNIGLSSDDGSDGNKIHNDRVFDFNIDAELIYASFLQAYSMDLYEQHGKLHWKRFISLLNNLPKETPFKEVVGYRTMKVPKKDEANKDYIDHVKKMKKAYKLPPLDSEQEIETQDNKMSDIASKFMRNK